MDNYIKQLIEDLHKATFNIRPPRHLWDHVNINSEVELEDMVYIEKYHYGEQEPIGEITTISSERLPEPNKLTVKQQKTLATELERLLQYCHFYLDFPINLPAHLKYPVIRNFWKEKHVAVGFGENRIEVCDMVKENCPFPGYCNLCDEMETQPNTDEENSSDMQNSNSNVEDRHPGTNKTE